VNDQTQAPGAAPTDSMFDGWESLNWQERRTRRFARWLTPAGVEFASDEVKAAYVERVQAVIDAVELRRPSRVPVVPMTCFAPAYYAGITPKEAMYDYEKLCAALLRFHEDLQPDFQAEPMGPGPVYELLGTKFMNWPGHGLADEQPWQYLEAEYMHPDEYDDLIADPSAYFMRKLLPRFADAFTGLAKLDPFSDVLEVAGLPFNIFQYADPDVAESLRRLADAAAASLQYAEAWMGLMADLIARLGIPSFWAGIAKAPYDCIADTLRGTKGIVQDRYRRPSKIIEAAERFAPLQIGSAVRQTALADTPLTCIPLHKGADGYMSDADFRKFYWPTLKALLRGLVDEGLVPVLIAEGGYNTRLEVVVDDDIPAGSVVWWFDQTDMAAARKALDGYACMGGNVPLAMLAVGTGQQVETYVTDLLDSVAKGGAFILGPGGCVDDAKAETFKAMIDAGRRWKA